VNIDALNAVITARDLSLLSLTATFRCACGSIATADLLTGQATCRCGAGRVEEYVQRAKAKAEEDEWKRERRYQDMMNVRRVSRARKVNGKWR